MKRILCLGDSNTWGYDSRTAFGEQYPESIRWTGILQQNGYEVRNFGYNGMCVPESAQLEWITNEVKREAPLDCITVMLGTNDLLRGSSVAQITAPMEILLRRLIAKQILLVSPPVLKPGEWVVSESMIEESRKLGAEYRRLAERMNVLFADAADWNIDVLNDGVHFSPEGHAVFAGKITEILNQVLQ